MPFWIRLELRRRWRSLLAMTLLIAIASAFVMTALAGARRGSSAIDRFDAAVGDPVDAVVLANTPGFDWRPIEDLPYVTGHSAFPITDGARIREIDAYGDFPQIDDHHYVDFDHPVVYEGRMYDPEADEAVISPDMAEATGLGVGDVVHARLPGKDQIVAGQGDGDYDSLTGPQFEVTIVGIARSTWMTDLEGPGGKATISPHATADYYNDLLAQEDNGIPVNLMFTLENGRADIERFRNDVARLSGRSDIDVWDWMENFDNAQEQVDFESRSLGALGLAALLASIFLIGQAVARLAGASSSELTTAKALGMTPRQITLSSSVGPVLAALAGGAAGAGGAAIASRWFPLGTASHTEPAPGIDLDWPVLTVGLVTTIVFTALVSTASAALAVRAHGATRPHRASPLAHAVASVGASVSWVVGTRFALEGGRGRTAVPVRPALLGAVIGVLGVSSVLVFSHGLADASDHPARFGQTYQLVAASGWNGEEGFQGPVSPDKFVADLSKVPDVTGVLDAPVGVVTAPDGSLDVQLFSLGQSDTKPLATVVTSGRLPETKDEITLTPGKLAEFHAEVGSTIDVTSDNGPRTLTVVGTAFVPWGPHNSYNEGAWVTPNGFDDMIKAFKYHLYYISTTAGTDSQEQGDAISAELVKVDPAWQEVAKNFGGHIVSSAHDQQVDASQDQANLRQVRVFPLVLAGFLALLAVGAVGHALATAVRRRAHDIAVLRATGLTPGQSRMIVAVQASVLALVGCVFGVPIGFALGRTIWRAVADFTPVAYVAPTALVALGVVVVSALLVAYAVAAWPAVRASRLKVAAVLRAE